MRKKTKDKIKKAIIKAIIYELHKMLIFIAMTTIALVALRPNFMVWIVCYIIIILMCIGISV